MKWIRVDNRLNGTSTRAMSNVLKILVCLAPLVGSVWIQPATARMTRSQSKKSMIVCITQTPVIRQPMDRPSIPSPSVVALSDTELDDEREPDELSKSAMTSPIGFTLDTRPADLSQIRSCSDRLSLHTFSINSFLRC